MTETDMAESAINILQHPEEEEEETKMPEEGENEENIGSSYNTNTGTNTSEFLKQLNLVLILSFLSLSAEERLDFEAIKPKDVTKHPKPKPSVSTFHVFKQEMKMNEFRALERQTHKFHAKIRDCRHSRRM